MHGMIHVEFKKFVEVKYDPTMYEDILKQAGLENKLFMAISSYEDTEFIAVVQSMQELTGDHYHRILEEFGEFITSDFIDMYSSLIDPSWTTADFLSFAEERVHPVVRLRNPGARPPVLKFTRLAPDELDFHYDSSRQMPAIARGIMKGVAHHYGETLHITEYPQEDGSVKMHIRVS